MRDILLMMMIGGVVTQEAAQERHPGMAIAERLVKTLPRLPNVIQGQMEGKPEELRDMISQMLGDGLISQLVVNPLGVAEGMGVSLSGLGINKTDVESRLGSAARNGTMLGGDKFPLFPFGVTTPAPTTEKVMYLDGVPIKDFDEFVRNRNLEQRFSTKRPMTTTTPIPSANDIAAAVIDKLQGTLPYPQRPSSNDPKPAMENLAAQNIDMAMIDPSRIQEVNTLLRRAPQKFDTNPNLLGSLPATFPQSSLDPEVNEVVTSLRTGTAMNVERIRQLQGILQSYEQSLQTKELIAKRKQLQLLQNELLEQRKKIEEQKKMEEALRKKEQELENQWKAMEIQLQQQLNMWHNSFSSSRDPGMPLLPLDLSELGHMPTSDVVSPTPAPMTTAKPQRQRAHVAILPPSSESSDIEAAPPGPVTSFPIVAESNQEKGDDGAPAVAVNQFWPTVVTNRNMRNHQPSNPTHAAEPSTSGEDEDGEFTSSCQCRTISLQKMKGRWSMALASKSLIEKLTEKLRRLLPSEPNAMFSCSRMTMLTPKISDVAQDARIAWEFRTNGSRKLHRLTGSALSMDHRSVRLQLRDFSNDIFSVPMCVLKYAGVSEYEYMVVTNGNGPCREAALLVRNVDRFFDEDNVELVDFLKGTFSAYFPAVRCGIQHDEVEMFNISDTQDAQVVIHLLPLKCGSPLDKEPTREEIKLVERAASILKDFKAHQLEVDEDVVAKNPKIASGDMDSMDIAPFANQCT